MACSESSANTYPGLPLGRGLELQLDRRHLRPWACMGCVARIGLVALVALFEDCSVFES